MNQGNTSEPTIPVSYDPFVGPEVVCAIPATEPQMEIAISCLLGGNDASRAYNECISLHLSGTLHRHQLEQACQAIIARHEMLRAVFNSDGRYISILEHVNITVGYIDLEGQHTAEQQKHIKQHAQQEALLPFDLKNGPLFRISLFRLSDTAHCLTLTLHHIVCDGWSLGILLQDLSLYYNAYCTGSEPEHSPAPLFSDYALEQDAYLQTEAFKNAEKYWIDKYRKNIPVLDMPIDTQRAAIRTYKSQRLDFAMDIALVQSLKKTGAKWGCSLNTTLLCAFELFLSRITGQHDIVVGLPAAGQSATGKHGLVGHCVQLLPIRSQPQASHSFESYLKERRPQIMDDFEHQQITFGSLLRHLHIPRDPSRVPLVPVVLNIDMGMDNSVTFNGLQHRLVSNPREYESFELFLNVSGSEQAMVLEWSYNSQLFTPGTIARFMAEFQALLLGMVNEPGKVVSGIAMHTDAPPQQNKKTIISAPAKPAKEKNFPAMFAAVAHKYPNNIAVRFQGLELTYESLNAQANQFAAYLQSKKIKQGDLVALAVNRCPEMLVAMLGILKAGAAYLPLDPNYPKNRTEYILSNANVRVLISTKKVNDSFTTTAVQLKLEDICYSLHLFPKDDSQVAIRDKGLAYAIYTSGSTGQPKGVAIEHHSLSNLLLSMQAQPGIEHHDRLLAVTTISFDIAGLELFLPLIAGATVVLADSDVVKDGRKLLALMQQEKISIMQATPSAWRMLVDASWEKPLPVKALCGGEALPKELAKQLLERVDSLWNMYGPTETTIWSAVKEITDAQAVTLGRPIDNTQIYLLDAALKPVGLGAEGEIFIAGEGVARGYINNPILTAERFLPDPFSWDPLEKMYRTGDLGRFLPGGELEFLGRVDQQLKVRGYRIEAGEIEYHLQLLEEIKVAIVIASDNQLVACILREKIKTDKTELQPGQSNLISSETGIQSLIPTWRKKLMESLPEYMVPTHFVEITHIPLTPNGKTDRNALLQQMKLGAPASTAPEVKKPVTDTEKTILKIWQDVLGNNKIGVTDDFFESGGHSIAAVDVLTQLEKQTGKQLPLASLFEAPTVEKLAQLVQDGGKSLNWNSLVPINPNGDKTPLYIVHGYGMNVLTFQGMAKHMDANQPVYGLQATGNNGINEPTDTLEGIAAFYVAEMVQQNPTGPFALAGYSFGGVIAFEMAKQLEAMGKEVVMLAMFDAYAESALLQSTPTQKAIKKVARQFPKLLFILNSLVNQPLQTINYQRLVVKRKLNALAGKSEPEFPIYGQSDINEQYERAYLNYKMSPYRGAIDLFRVKIRIYFLDDPTYLGWKPFAKKGVHIHEIAGDHKTFLEAPNDREFARKLQACLDQRAKERKTK